MSQFFSFYHCMFSTLIKSVFKFHICSQTASRALCSGTLTQPSLHNLAWFKPSIC